MECRQIVNQEPGTTVETRVSALERQFHIVRAEAALSDLENVEVNRNKSIVCDSTELNSIDKKLAAMEELQRQALDEADRALAEALFCQDLSKQSLRNAQQRGDAALAFEIEKSEREINAIKQRHAREVKELELDRAKARKAPRFFSQMRTSEVEEFQEKQLKRFRELAGQRQIERRRSDIEVDDCIICLEALEARHHLFKAACGHIWHFECVLPLLDEVKSTREFKCPNCCRRFSAHQRDGRVKNPSSIPAHRHGLNDI